MPAFSLKILETSAKQDVESCIYIYIYICIFFVADGVSMMGNKKVVDQLFKGVCVGLWSPRVIQAAIETVADVSSIVVIRILKSCFSIMLENR